MTRRGVKEVVKSLRKGKRGIVVLAGDITPVELVAHIPILCEKHSIPYIYVNSKDELSGAALSKNPTTVVMLARPSSDSEFREIYKKYFDLVKAANPYLA
jgi:H/ACA ribonucleoprotein complex subunit 2